MIDQLAVGAGVGLFSLLWVHAVSALVFWIATRNIDEITVGHLYRQVVDEYGVIRGVIAVPVVTAVFCVGLAALCSVQEETPGDVVGGGI